MVYMHVVSRWYCLCLILFQAYKFCLDSHSLSHGVYRIEHILPILPFYILYHIRIDGTSIILPVGVREVTWSNLYISMALDFKI